MHFWNGTGRNAALMGLELMNISIFRSAKHFYLLYVAMVTKTRSGGDQLLQ